MKKIFTFLVAFLTTVSGAVWGQYQDLCDGPIRINDDKTYYITCSGQTNNGITVEAGSAGDKNEPTIYLKDININVGGSGIIISNYSTVKLILEGTNTIVSNGEDAAIDLGNRDASATEIELIIDESSTGILNIQTANNDDVAIGNCYAGGNMSPCGSLTVRGGTINTNGRIGHFTGHAFRFGGNAIVIANDIEGFDHNDKDMRRGGLLFLNDDTPYVGEFHNAADDPEFTLNSPLPEPYKIELRTEGVKVEIGPDQTLNEDQLINKGGQIKGYKVTYSSSQIEGVTTAELPTTKFVGSAYKVEAWEDNADNSSDPSTTYERIDQWLLNESGSNWISAGSTITGSMGDYTTLSNIPTKNYQAVWYLKEKSITINLTGTTGKFEGSFALWYPDEPEMLLTATEQTLGALAGVGLKISEDGRTISGVDELGIITDGEHTVNLSLAATAGDNKPSNRTTTLNVNVIIKEYTADEVEATATTSAGEALTYNGKSRKGDIKVKVKPKSGTGTIAAKFYSVVFKKQNADEISYGEEQEDIRDAGTYQVIVKATDVPDQVLAKDFEKDAGTVTISQATLTVKEKTSAEWTIGDDKLTKDPAFTLETICSDENGDLDKVEIDTYDITKPTSTPTTPGEYDITYSNFKLKGADAANYTVDGSSTVTGKVKVSKEGTTEDPIDDDIEIGDEDWTDGKRTYDGLPHNLKSIKVKYGEGEQTITLGENANITYTYKQDATAEGEGENVDEVKNAGVYVAHFTFPTENNYGYSGDGKVTLTIEKATLSVEATGEKVQVAVGKELPKSIEISNNDENPYIKFNTQNNEVAVYTAELELGESVSSDGYEDGATITGAYSVNDVALAKGEGFDPSNYDLKLSQISVDAVVGKITINPDTDGEGGDEDGDDVTGGDTGEDEQPNTDDDFILISPEGKDKCSVYDGDPHGLDWLKVGDEVLLKDVDYSVLYDGAENEPVNAGEYTATIKLAEDGDYKLESGGTSFDLTIHIAERPVTVGFDLPASIDASTKTLDASDYDDWQKEDVVPNEGLVNGEDPICEGTLFLVESEDYPGYFDVYLDKKTFKVEDNPSSSFLVSNYIISVETKDGKIKLEENGEGGETLPDDPNDPRDPIIDGPDEDDLTGGIEIDDNTGSGSGITTKRYQLYLANKDYNVKDAKEDYAAEGLELFSRHNKKYAEAGGSFTVWYEKDGVANAGGYRIFWSNRANGEYKEVKFDTVSEYFQIRNVQSDVYVKIYAADGFPVGNEEISAADYRAYAQPNKIVVITPQPTDVQIISMAGAVVATDKVTGQREFANLTEGVYIVRMGETVVKLQVRK